MPGKSQSLQIANYLLGNLDEEEAKPCKSIIYQNTIVYKYIAN